MTLTWALMIRCVAMMLVHAVLVRFLREVKYQAAPRARPTTWGDWGVAAFGGIAITTLVMRHSLAAALGIVLATGLFWLLWFDAWLYRVFALEIGFHGLEGVALLYQEVTQFDYLRNFFSTRRRFLLLPLAILIAHLGLLLPQASLPQFVLGLTLAGYLVSTLIVPAESMVTDPAGRSMKRRALVHDMLRLRRPLIPAGFRPRPEHAALLARAPALPTSSAYHARLRGASVVLLTFESLGEAHLRGEVPDSQAQARTPFLDSLRLISVSSKQHFCLAPLTNCAHIALYASQPEFTPGPLGLSALQTVGYKTIYLTTANTSHYGLNNILQRAGFQHILDSRVLTPYPEDGSQISDRALLGDGMQRLRALVQADEPFFLHVHGANTHFPYRVADSARFCHHDALTGHGRFLNGVEECDAIFRELWTGLHELSGGQVIAPILVVSSDHGQSFGEKGYFAHGSAVTHEQISLPLFLMHPKLRPCTVDFSTHFDVLPTLLDLVGVDAGVAGLGQSIFTANRSAGHLLWDGHPSRRASSCLGLLFGDRKYSLDLVRCTCVESDWDDANPKTLSDDESRYFEALIGEIARLQGVQ